MLVKKVRKLVLGIAVGTALALGVAVLVMGVFHERHSRSRVSHLSGCACHDCGHKRQ